MMSTPLCFLMFGLIALRPVEGTRLGRLEEDLNSLKGLIFKELGYIRDDVKEISHRVDILENKTDTHDPSSLNQDMDIPSYNLGDKTGESGKQLVRAGNSKAGHVVKAEVQNMRKAYSNDKKDLHQLKQDVKGQLRELEQKITSHMHNLTADVQHNIEYIHENISLAKITLSEFINGSSTNLSIFSVTFKDEIKDFFTNTSEQLVFRFNATESEMKQNISSTYRTNEIEFENILSLAVRNVSEIILKAEILVSVIRSNFLEMPSQITNLSLELQSTKNEIKGIEERLGYTFNSTSNELKKNVFSLKACFYKEIYIYDGYYLSCKDSAIRLANASKYGSTGVQGRLEVRHDYMWGTVCDDSFDGYVVEPYMTNNINVICSMFGFRECDFELRAGMGRGSGDIWMDDVKCGEGESSFLECPHEGWGVHNCGHGEDVGFRMWN